MYNGSLERGLTGLAAVQGSGGAGPTRRGRPCRSIAFATDLGVPAGKSDRAAVKEGQKVLVVESWAHSRTKL